MTSTPIAIAHTAPPTEHSTTTTNRTTTGRMMPNIATRRPSANAERLLELAVEVIDQQGEAGIRVQELADQVGVAITILYRFFGNRDGLIAAAQTVRVRRQLDSELDRFADEVARAEDALGFRRSFEDILARLLSPESAVERLRIINAIGSSQARQDLRHELGEIVDAAVERLATTLEIARARSWIDPDQHLPTVAAWVIGLVSARVYIELGPSGADGERWNQTTIAAVNSVLFGTAAH